MNNNIDGLINSYVPRNIQVNFMIQFEKYISKNKDPFLNSPPRNKLRYIASDIHYLSMLSVNPKGIDPIEYILYAKADLISKDVHGSINAIGNAKRAVHLLIDSLLEITGLSHNFSSRSFPQKLDIIEKSEFFPTILIKSLNEERNIIEHEYQKISFEEARKFVAVAEMLQLLCYPILKRFINGIHIGLEEDDRDIFLYLDNSLGKLGVLSCENAKCVDSEIGKIYYHFPTEAKNSTKIISYDLKLQTVDEWLPYFSTLVYSTKHNLIPSNPPYDPKYEENIMEFENRAMFSSSDAYTIDDSEKNKE
ncbi:MAG: hypothetical protein NTZ27_10985 [Ignavibacteriales bacterium]|nr:hypothetical protein [Ignavibacteriales bacterium]